MRNYIILIFLFFIKLSPSFAQQRVMYGVNSAMNVNIHTADFRAFPTVPNCCPRFENGTGSGLTLGIVYDMPLTEMFRLTFRGTFTEQNGLLSRDENIVLAGNVNGIFNHSIDTKISGITFEPFLGYYLFDKFRINGGLAMGFRTRAIFSQKEIIVEPSSGTFSNGQRSQNEVSDSPIPFARDFSLGMLGGVSYNLRLNKRGTLYLSPEIVYQYPLIGIVNSIDWSVQQLRFGATFFWSPRPYKEPIRREEQNMIIDTIEVKVPSRFAGFYQGKDVITKEIVENEYENDTEIVTYSTIRRTDTNKIAKPERLDVDVKAFGINSKGMIEDNIVFRIDEYSTYFMNPFLNYVFFEEGSDVIPSRFVALTNSDVEKFSIEGIKSSDRLQTYYHLLNIVGLRMRQNPTIQLTLTGCNTDAGSEENNLSLSKRRAESVKKYLMDVWTIPAGRIQVIARNLPEKSANRMTSLGAEENRRVEISSTTQSLLLPFSSSDTVRVSNPPSARFMMNVQHDNPISEWSLDIMQNTTVLEHYEGKNDVPTSIQWDIASLKKEKPLANSPIQYRLIVKDELGKIDTSQRSIRVEYKTVHEKRVEKIADKEINRFGLILFDIRSTDINENNKPIIGMIKKMIQPNSTVKIIGFTDQSGDPAINKVLAEKRAKTTARALGIPENSPLIEANGNSATYDPALPEGRLYTRTVDVIIETPINE